MSVSTSGAGVLAAEGISLGYPSRPLVVREVDVTIRPGSFTVIVGANACGKSTLLRGLARLLPAERGRAVLDGRSVTRYSSKEFARAVAMLSQSAVAPAHVTVTELVAHGRYPHQGVLRQWSPADEAAVREALDRTGLRGLADRPVAEMSGGQRQRVWIAMALAQQTDILLLDEPTTFLDVAGAREVLEVCRELNATGITIVAVLHELNTAARYADEIIAMRDGAVIAQGPPATVVTEELVAHVFDLDALVMPCPVSGAPMVVPR